MEKGGLLEWVVKIFLKMSISHADRRETYYSLESPKAFFGTARQGLANFRWASFRRATLPASFEPQNLRPKSKQFHFNFQSI